MVTTAFNSDYIQAHFMIWHWLLVSNLPSIIYYRQPTTSIENMGAEVHFGMIIVAPAYIGHAKFAGLGLLVLVVLVARVRIVLPPLIVERVDHGLFLQLQNGQRDRVPPRRTWPKENHTPSQTPALIGQHTFGNATPTYVSLVIACMCAMSNVFTIK